MKRTLTEQTPSHLEELIQTVKNNALPLKTPTDLDPLMEMIGESKYVLLGEASHGTHEYYTWRSKITKRLIEEKGFSFIGVEGDWPDCYRLNRYVKHCHDAGKNAFDVLHSFNRWPTWMWANWEIVALAEWMRNHNKKLPSNKRIGFYGLDVYSLVESLDAILNYLKKTDKAAFDSAKKTAACFEQYGFDGENYARSTYLVPDSCENDVNNLLREIRSKIANYNTDHETVFNTEQNVITAVNAEKYYRAMVRGGAPSWNIRDKHMTETLNRLMKFHGSNAKAVVWAHNTHIGDARATDMAQEGMTNIGEIVTKEHHQDGVVKIGFGSWKGNVIAGHQWGDPIQKLTMPEGKIGSWEDILHKSGANNKMLFLDKWKREIIFNQPIPHRAVGVVYNPEYERFGNYVPSILPYRYDAFLFFNETNALHPIHIEPDGNRIPETYPFGV